MTGAVCTAPSLGSSQPLVPDKILTTSSVWDAMTLLFCLGIFSITFEISLFLLVPCSCSLGFFFSSISMVSVSVAFESCVAYSNRACCLCCLSKAHISSMSNIWKAVKRFLSVNRSVAPFKICCHLVALYWLKLQDSYHTFYVQIGEDELWLKALHDALGVGMCSRLFLVLP